MRRRLYRTVLAWVADLAWMLACLLALLIAIAATHGRPSWVSVTLIVTSLVGLVGVGICVRASRTTTRGSDDIN